MVIQQIRNRQSAILRGSVLRIEFKQTTFLYCEIINNYEYIFNNNKLTPAVINVNFHFSEFRICILSIYYDCLLK